MKDYKALIFEDPTPTPTAYDGGEYCDFDTAAAVMAGKDVLLAVWNADGSELLAIDGQQSLTINRSAETIEVNSKSENGWKDSLVGLREWSIDLDSLYIPSADSHKALATAFDNGDPICIKVYNNKTKKGMFGGLGILTTFDCEFPEDDVAVASISLQGKGALVDFSIHTPTSDVMPE